jgi:hypothetical protein
VIVTVPGPVGPRIGIASSPAFDGIVWTHQIDYAIHAIGDLGQNRKHDRDVSELFTVGGGSVMTSASIVNRRPPKSLRSSPSKLMAPTVRLSLEKRSARLADIRLAALIEKQNIQVLAAVKNRPESLLDLLHDLSPIAAWRHQPQNDIVAAPVAQVGMRQISRPHDPVIAERSRELLLQAALEWANLLAPVIRFDTVFVCHLALPPSVGAIRGVPSGFRAARRRCPICASARRRRLPDAIW